MAEDSEESYTMIDLLAFKCTELQEKLTDFDSDLDEKLIFDYLESAENQFKVISDFKEDCDWFNVIEPLSHENLKGKIIVLDFFTYCCINCMHILPDLKKIEQLFSVEDGLLIIGVHSAKFDNEKDSSNLLSAIQRYDITHPVINDSNSTMWNELNIQCWPTLLILGPNANPIFVLMGEGNYDILKKYISFSLKYYKQKGLIKEHSLPLNPATELFIANHLKFPGKIVCSKKSLNDNCAELYAISDSGNNRILILNSSGQVIQKIGGKLPGYVDGDFISSRFNNPQGLDFLNQDILFVADTDNHAVRRINLRLKQVDTVAGNGRQGNDRVGGKIGKLQEISSPWDIAIYKTKDMDMSFHMDETVIPEKTIVLIAMAGIHQIWALFLDDVIWWKYKKYNAGQCAAIAGSGLEGNRNNSYPNNATFAQPSGIAISRELKQLYIADSESSSIRAMSLQDGKVSPVIGGDHNPVNLFAFGDCDGKLYSAKLQHPLGVAFDEKNSLLYVADTYNHKIKCVNVNTNVVNTCKILSKSNHTIAFNEPGGLCLNPNFDILYITDTNNHTIEMIDLNTMKQKTFNIIFDLNNNSKDLGKIIEYSALKIKSSGGKIRLSVSLKFLDIHLTDDAPQKWNVYLPTENWYINQQNGIYNKNEPIELDITVPYENPQIKNNEIYLTFKLNFCHNNLCFPKIFSIKFNVYFSDVELDCIIEEVCCKISEKDIYF